MAQREFEVRWLDHDADLMLSVEAPTPESLFAMAGEALVGMLVEPSRVDAADRHEVRLSGTAREDLLVDWLNEIIFLVDSGRFRPVAVEELSLDGNQLEASFRGNSGGEIVRRHDFKAATYHDLVVEEWSGGWVARIVFDV